MRYVDELLAEQLTLDELIELALLYGRSDVIMQGHIIELETAPELMTCAERIEPERKKPWHSEPWRQRRGRGRLR